DPAGAGRMGRRARGHARARVVGLDGAIRHVDTASPRLAGSAATASLDFPCLSGRAATSLFPGEPGLRRRLPRTRTALGPLFVGGVRELARPQDRVFSLPADDQMLPEEPRPP